MMYSCQQTGGPAKGKSNYSGRHHRISGNLLHRGGIDGNHIGIYILYIQMLRYLAYRYTFRFGSTFLFYIYLH